MNGETRVGYFRGRKTIQRSGTIGGSRAVFVKIQGNKNELTYPSIGGYIKNPFKGKAKFFAGDLVEYRTDSNGVNPEIFFLKTYLVVSVSEDKKTVSIARDSYKHIPFVGDKIGVAPEKIGGEVSAVTVTEVAQATESGADVWKLTLSAALTTAKGDVLVEADSNGKMLVKAINSVAPTDLDMFDAPATGDDDFDGARYSYTPALGGIMYINRMSPLPACVLALNKSAINGWFQVQSV